MSDLIPKTEERKFDLQIAYMISCPVICHVGYENTLTKNQRDKYSLEAMLNIRETFNTEIAPPYHMLIYFSQVSLIAVLPRSFARIYFKLMRDYFGKEKIDFISEYDTDLDENEIDEMNRLGRWIFKKQIEHIKTQIKETKN